MPARCRPRRGFWTIPAGFLELNETVVDGARREAREEACAEIESIAFSGFITCRGSARCRSSIARACRHRISASGEAQEVVLFSWDDVPDEIAFPSVHWALNDYRAVEGVEVCTAQQARGRSPNFNSWFGRLVVIGHDLILDHRDLGHMNMKVRPMRPNTEFPQTSVLCRQTIRSRRRT